MDGDASMGAAVAADLANTAPPVWGEDRLADLDQLASFLRDHGLPPGRRLRIDDLERVHALRSTLRQVFTATDEQAVVDTLNALLADADVHPRLVGGDGKWSWRLDPSPDALPVASLTVVAAVGLLSLVHDDGLARLGKCAAPGCAGVFADTTRNRSRRYCIPELCGNRVNLAAYRARKRTQRHP